MLHGASTVLKEFVDKCNQYGGNVAGAQGVPEEMIRENEAVKKSCLENRIRFFEIGADFNSFVRDVFDWLDGKGKT